MWKKVGDDFGKSVCTFMHILLVLYTSGRRFAAARGAMIGAGSGSHITRHVDDRQISLLSRGEYELCFMFCSNMRMCSLRYRDCTVLGIVSTSSGTLTLYTTIYIARIVHHCVASTPIIDN